MMKKTFRLFALLLSVLMIGSLFAVAASADFEPDANNTASWKVDDGKLVGDNTAGANESNLKLFELPAGLTDYTVEAEMTLLTASGSQYGALLSNWKSGTEYVGVWVRANGTVNFEQRATSYTKVPAEAPAAVTEIGVNVTYKLKLHFHGGTADLYIGEGTTPYAAGTLQLGEYSGYVAVMIKPGTKIAFDNFKVTNNTTSAVLWEEQFAGQSFEPDANNTAAWTVADGKLVGDNTAGANESNLKLFELPAGLTDYTVEAEMTLLTASGSQYGALLSNWKSGTEYVGVWVRANGTVNFEQRATSYTKVPAEAPAAVTEIGVNVTYKLKLHFHGGTADLYIGEGTTPYAAGTLQLGEYSGYVAVMIKPGTKIAFDNFKVTNNTSSAVLWQDDFSSGAGEWGEKTEEKLGLDTFGWTVNPQYNSTGYEFKISGKFGAAGNKSLHIHADTDNWCGMIIAPAEKLTDVKQYVFSVKTAFDSARKLTFRFNSSNEASADGDWGGVSWNTQMENVGYEGSTTKSNANIDNVTYDLEMNEIAIAFDLEAGTEKIYLNGTLLSTRSTDVHSASGAVSMIVRMFDGYVDDLMLEAGTFENRGNLIWKEDFESYELSAGEEAVKERPAQDYTGRTPGQVIFEDDYNAVQNLEDFYFVAKLSGDFGKAEYSIADSIDGTPCARITGNWASVEIVPKEVFTPYQTYTIHMKVKFDSNENRFALFYNTASPLSNSNSGFLDIRYHDPVKIENLGIVGGSVLKDEANTEAKIGEPFDLAVTVRCDGGTNLVYINGEIVSAGAGINTTQSALYIVVQSCVAYIDDVKVTAGTYDDYLALNTPQGGEESTSVESDETTTAPTPGTTAPEQTTESAPVSTEAPSETASTETPSGSKGGCGSVIGTGALALIGVLSLGCVFIGKRRETF